MKISELRCRRFRNLEDVTLCPCDGVNVVFGENAQGKTNLMEAVWLFSGMKSFRGAKDAELIAHGQEFAKLSLKFSDSRRENTAEITITNKRAAVFNGVKLPSAPSLIGKFSAVVFAPSFLSIIEDGPSERRRFLDTAVCQLKPAYAGALAEYTRVLRQRNSLLKDIAMESSLYDLLDILDEKLCAAGARISEERKQYLQTLAPAATEIYNGLSSGREAIGFEYISKYEGDLAEALKAARREDVLNKTTTVGPHRDDVEITLNGTSVRAFGSQGQKRSCAVALKLTEAEILKNETGEQPVILLDDVMSELDVNRQDFILNHLGNRQVFITCCEPGTVLRAATGQRIEMKDGRIMSVEF
jgi:DNA replication and repair protein RecF